MKILFWFSVFIHSVLATENSSIPIYWGYITQIHCQGRLYLSSVGNSKLLTREAFPKELGCGVLIQPDAETGTTDLLLKTSTGDIHRILEIKKPLTSVAASQLEIYLHPEKEIQR